MPGDMRLSVQARTRGLWRLVVVRRLLLYVRPRRLAVWLICRWLDERVGVDTKIGNRKWESTARFKVFATGEE